MTTPIQGYKLGAFVPEAVALDQDFHIAMRRRLEDLMRMQGFEQTTRVEVRVLSHDELGDCPLRPGYRIVEAYVDVDEYDIEVPAVEEDQEDPVLLEVSEAPEPYVAMGERRDVTIQAPVGRVANNIDFEGGNQ